MLKQFVCLFLQESRSNISILWCRHWSSHSPLPAEHPNSLTTEWSWCLLAFCPYKSSSMQWCSLIRKSSLPHLPRSLLANSPTRVKIWEWFTPGMGMSLTSTSFNGHILEHKWQKPCSAGSLAVHEGVGRRRGGDMLGGGWSQAKECLISGSSCLDTR